MRTKRIVAFFLSLILLTAQSVFAFETDQYNLPEQPLADIGDEVSEYVRENIQKALDKINARIAERQKCADGNTAALNCNTPEKERAALAELRSESAVAREVYKLLGGGIPPFTNSGTWMEKHKFKAQPARFKTSFSKSIYRTAPVNYLTISETVKLYDVMLGTDKIAHIFQQGYTYYRTVARAREKGSSDAEALRKAVNWGRTSEKTYYGFWVSGVYSNADLAANYAGWKFYESLTRETRVGDGRLAPLLALKNGFWQFYDRADARRESVLKAFISNHLNEALNPSVYMSLFGFRSVIRKTVKTQACGGWRKNYPELKKADYEALTENLRLWYGEDYGFKNSRSLVTIAGTCF